MNNMDDFDKLANESSKQVGENPFGKKGKQKSVWINEGYFKKIKMMTVEHDKYTISDLMNMAMSHAFKDNIFNDYFKNQK